MRVMPPLKLHRHRSNATLPDRCGLKHIRMCNTREIGGRGQYTSIMHFLHLLPIPANIRSFRHRHVKNIDCAASSLIESCYANLRLQITLLQITMRFTGRRRAKALLRHPMTTNPGNGAHSAMFPRCCMRSARGITEVSPYTCSAFLQ